MKYLKMLGLALVAATAFAAFAGAGTASAASELCETNVSSCPPAWDVNSGATLDFSVEPGTSATLTGPFGETIATCTESTVKGTTANTAGASGTITALSFSTCNHPVTVNTATTGSLSLSHTAEAETAAPNATVKSTDTTVTIDGTLFGNCQYLTNETSIGTLRGGSPATFFISAKIPSENGCPKGTWEGSYIATGTSTLYFN